MTDKELKKLHRTDLLDLIYEMKKTELELRQELQNAESRLQAREYAVQEAGSIAAAALSLNGVFESAQRAADDYLAQIQENSEEAQRRASALLSDTERECKQRIETADRECEQRIAAAEREIAQKWEAFEEKVRKTLQAHSELTDFLQSTSPNDGASADS